MTKEITLDKESVESIIERLTELNEYYLSELVYKGCDFDVEYRLTSTRSYAETSNIIHYLKGLLKENE